MRGEFCHDQCLKAKKEEFPGLMEDMLPGNSFPQICVVSRHESLERNHFAQEYGRSGD
jgi:hypothetical protein